MTLVYSLALFLLAIILDFIFNRLVFEVETLNFFLIIPAAVLILKKDKYGCVFLTIMGIVQDSMSSAFFGIYGFAAFLTSINLYWMTNKYPGDSPLLFFIFGLMAQILFNAYMILFLNMAERLNFLTPHLYSLILFSVIPSAIVTVFICYILNKLTFFSENKKTVSK